VNPQATAVEITRLIRQRQAVLTSAAMCVAIPGVCAFMVALFFFSD
jgi:hypothetical protein